MKGNEKKNPVLFGLMLSILECKLNVIKKKKKHLEKQLIPLALKILAKSSSFLSQRLTSKHNLSLEF